MPNKGHQASQTLAAEQARKKSAELSKVGVLSMSLVINNGESSPELSGEEEFAQWCWQVLEDNGVREKFQQILMLKGWHLNHFNNRAVKIATMQELCNSRLPTFPIPLHKMTDFTTVKNFFFLAIPNVIYLGSKALHIIGVWDSREDDDADY